MYTGNISFLHGAFRGYSLHKFPPRLKRWITILIVWPAESVVVEAQFFLNCGVSRSGFTPIRDNVRTAIASQASSNSTQTRSVVTRPCNGIPLPHIFVPDLMRNECLQLLGIEQLQSGKGDQKNGSPVQAHPRLRYSDYFQLIYTLN